MPAEEADVDLSVSVTDVMRRFEEPSDYTGELQANLTLRMTDRFSGATADAPATIRDLPLLFDIQCVPTSNTSIGSTCALSTTADAITPSFVREGKRTIWQVGQVRLFDGGEDGITSTQSDNALFMKQGIFVP